MDAAPPGPAPQALGAQGLRQHDPVERHWTPDPVGRRRQEDRSDQLRRRKSKLPFLCPYFY